MMRLGTFMPDGQGMTSEAEQIVERLGGLAGRRGPARPRAPRGPDRLLRLADHAPAPATPEDAARLLHAILSAARRKAISEPFAARLLERLLPKAVAARPRPTVTLELPEVTDAASYAEAQAAVLRAAAAGRLTPSGGQDDGGGAGGDLARRARRRAAAALGGVARRPWLRRTAPRRRRGCVPSGRGAGRTCAQGHALRLPTHIDAPRSIWPPLINSTGWPKAACFLGRPMEDGGSRRPRSLANG
jgi:hypothetical protein